MNFQVLKNRLPSTVCCSRRLYRRGQAMILTTLALGGSILGATTIAGLLMVYQIRQASDLGGSTRAIYAADAGIEWGLYNFFVGSVAQPAFGNSASFNATCFYAGSAVDCTNASTTVIRSVGRFGNVSRALELNF